MRYAHALIEGFAIGCHRRRRDLLPYIRRRFTEPSSAWNPPSERAPESSSRTQWQHKKPSIRKGDTNARAYICVKQKRPL